MQAGRLDRRVTLRKLTEGQSASGAVIYTPEDVATVWAQKVPERGSEAFREQQVQGWAPVVWRVRHIQDTDLADPTVKWDLVEGARVYEILSVTEINRREGWELVTRCRAEDQVA